MTADEFDAVLAAIGWSRTVLAERLGMSSDRAVRRWSSGQNPIPPRIAVWLRQVAHALDNLPPPDEWRDAGAHRGPAADTALDE